MAADDDDAVDGDVEDDALRLARQVAEVIQRLRQLQGYTLEDLAERAGLHRTSVGLVERGERHLGLASAARLAAALGTTLADVVAEAERELGMEVVEGAAPVPGPPVEIVRRRPRRTVNPEYFENEESLREHLGLGIEWLGAGMESCYDTLDLIDEQLAENGAEPMRHTVELANLSSMIGNLLGGGLAAASGGVFVRNRPHAYPDLLSQADAVPDTEIKMGLETNKPKGHLPKEGWHITFRYVLADREGNFTIGKDNRGDTAWIWEVRIGDLTAADYDLSNTEGDSGKTAVIKTETFKNMTRIYYDPTLLPYAGRTGPYGDVPLI